MTFLIIDGTRHWPSIWHLFLKNIKVKGHQYPDYLFSKCIQDSWILLIIIADNIAVRPKKKDLVSRNWLGENFFVNYLPS